MSLMFYSFLADVVVAVHVAYVGFVMVGLLLILAGWLWRWGWVRNPWFRIAHLLAIVTVGLEAVCGIDCPLTVWEDRLRALAGQEVNGVSFVGRMLHRMIFYEVDPWILDLGHILFALLVIAVFVAAPPRLRRTEGR
jgi:polyferredoxin